MTTANAIYLGVIAILFAVVVVHHWRSSNRFHVPYRKALHITEGFKEAGRKSYEREVEAKLRVKWRRSKRAEYEKRMTARLRESEPPR